MKEISTRVEMPLTKSATSPIFSAGGNWTLQTFGPWRGELRLETKSDEEAPWHPSIAVRHEGQPHPLGEQFAQHDRSGGTQKGTHAYYRFVFTATEAKESRFRQVIKRFHPATQVPRAVFEAESVVIDP